MKRLQGAEYEEINNEHGRFAIVRVGKQFGICKWNPHHSNWVRSNKLSGGGVHHSPVALMHDNLGGGAILMSLSRARELVAYGLTE